MKTLNETRKVLCALLFIFVGQAAFSQETLSGKFELNPMLNQYANGDEAVQQQFRQMLETTNMPLIEEYIAAANKLEFEKADSLIQTDDKLSRMPQRMVILLYDYYKIKEAGLLDYHCIVLDKSSESSTKVVFLTEKQLKKLQPKLADPMLLKVKQVGEAPLVKLTFYKLTED